MQVDPNDQIVQFVPVQRVSRRTVVACAAKLVGGVSLSLIAGGRLAQVAAAQDDEIILTATAAEVGARPGSAYANGYAARAAADQDAGATTQGATTISGAAEGFLGAAETVSGDTPNATDADPTGCGGRCQ
jgi:hypothetical protein